MENEPENACYVGATLLTFLDIIVVYMWINSMYNVFDTEDKILWKYKSKKLCYEKNFNRGFWFLLKIKSLTFAWFFTHFGVTQFGILFVLFIRIKYDNSKIKKSIMRTI